MKGERSRHTVIVAPPAVEQVGKAWDLIDSRAVVICADHEQAALWAEAAPPEHRAHAVTGLARTAALLKEGRVGLLAGSPPDLAALVARSALKLESIDTLVIAWPESFADELDAVLAEAPNARRVILSWNPPALSEFLERHARRAEVSGDLPLDSDGNPLGPVGSARYAVVSSARRAAGARDTLNTLRATRPYVWYGGEITPPKDPDVVVAGTLPTRDEMRALIATQAQPVVLALATQLPYLEDHDPALVAAALLALQRETGTENQDTVAPPPSESGAWARLFVTTGRKDKASAKDLVGALIKEAGLEKGQIGKIDVRETFSLVEVAPTIAEQAARRLTGVSIRGRRVTARPDRA